MGLLNSQKDQIFDLIEATDFTPVQFIFEETQGINNPSVIVTKVNYAKTNYFFSFETNQLNEDGQWAIFSPSDEKLVDKINLGSWDFQKSYFSRWLSYLLREIQAPNKWDRLSKEIEKIDFEPNVDSTQFTIAEYEKLVIDIKTVNEEIIKLKLDESQTTLIIAKLNSLTDLAKQLNKFDWVNLLIGTIITLVTHCALAPEKAKALWDTIKTVFNTYFLK